MAHLSAKKSSLTWFKVHIIPCSGAKDDCGSKGVVGVFESWKEDGVSAGRWLWSWRIKRDFLAFCLLPLLSSSSISSHQSLTVLFFYLPRFTPPLCHSLDHRCPPSPLFFHPPLLIVFVVPAALFHCEDQSSAALLGRAELIEGRPPGSGQSQPRNPQPPPNPRRLVAGPRGDTTP